MRCVRERKPVHVCVCVCVCWHRRVCRCWSCGPDPSAGNQLFGLPPLSNPVHLPRLYFLIRFFHYFLFPTSSSYQLVLLSVIPHPSLSFSNPVISVAYLSSVDPSRSHLFVQNPVSTSPSDVDNLFMELFSFCRCSSFCPLSGNIQQHHS